MYCFVLKGDIRFIGVFGHVNHRAIFTLSLKTYSIFFAELVFC